jgi:hypothetical protein
MTPLAGKNSNALSYEVDRTSKDSAFEFLYPERSFMHLTVFCSFLISSGWGGSSVVMFNRTGVGPEITRGLLYIKPPMHL